MVVATAPNSRVSCFIWSINLGEPRTVLLVERLTHLDQLVQFVRVIFQGSRDPTLDVAMQVLEVFDSQTILAFEELLREVIPKSRSLLLILFQLFLDLVPLVLVSAFEETQDVYARSQCLRLADAVEELAKGFASLFQVLLFEAPLGFVGHRWNLVTLSSTKMVGYSRIKMLRSQ